MKLQIKTLHDAGDPREAVLVADGKSYNLAAGETVTLDVTHSLNMNLSAVDGTGTPLGNTVSDPRQPGVGKSVTDPRPTGDGGHSTQHEPNSPPNPGTRQPGPAASASPPPAQPNNEGLAQVNEKAKT